MTDIIVSVRPQSWRASNTAADRKGKIEGVEKVVRIFNGFEEAEAADVESDLRRPREQRIELLLQLRELMYPDAAEQGFARVYRVAQLDRG